MGTGTLQSPCRISHCRASSGHRPGACSLQNTAQHSGCSAVSSAVPCSRCRAGLVWDLSSRVLLFAGGDGHQPDGLITAERVGQLHQPAAGQPGA